MSLLYFIDVIFLLAKANVRICVQCLWQLPETKDTHKYMCQKYTQVHKYNPGPCSKPCNRFRICLVRPCLFQRLFFQKDPFQDVSFQINSFSGGVFSDYILFKPCLVILYPFQHLSLLTISSSETTEGEFFSVQTWHNLWNNWHKKKKTYETSWHNKNYETLVGNVFRHVS